MHIIIGNCWTCHDLSDKVRASPKLSVIKQSIDRLYLAERKNNAVRCFEISSDGTRTESNVVEYLKTIEQYSYSGREIIRIWVALLPLGLEVRRLLKDQAYAL